MYAALATSRAFASVIFFGLSRSVMGLSLWGGKRRVGRALAWNGNVPLVGATGAITLCHAIETSVFFFALYIPTTYPYHLSFQSGSRLKRERHFPSPSSLFEEMFAEMWYIKEWTHPCRNWNQRRLVDIRN